MGTGVIIPVDYGQVRPNHGREAVEGGRLREIEGMDIDGGRLGVRVYVSNPSCPGAERGPFVSPDDHVFRIV